MFRHYEVTVEGVAEAYRCRDGQTLLSCLETRPGKALTVGCKGGGCGVCKVEILSGQYSSRRMSRAHISSADEAHGVVLACRVTPMSDMAIRVIGLLKKRFAVTASNDVQALGDIVHRAGS